jgi:hypothetical protein
MKITSPRKIAAARANGALSRGPKTPAGKARSSCNALRHGLRSKIVCLPTEDHDAFNQTLESYTRRLAPRDALEISIARQIVAAVWRHRRAMNLERELLDSEIAAIPNAATELDRLTIAFSNLAETSRIQAVLRYQAHFFAQRSRLLREYLHLRRHRIPYTSPLPNEPKTLLSSTTTFRTPCAKRRVPQREALPGPRPLAPDPGAQRLTPARSAVYP